MTQPPLVSVIVLNYNGRKFVDDCFGSLAGTAYHPVEIILVDNASTDGSVEYVREKFPQVRIIRAPANLGYTGGNNLGLRNAVGKYAVLLNNDVQVEPDWLTHLVNEAESDDRLAALQPKLTSMIHRGYFEYAGASGGFIDRYGYAFLRGRLFDTMEKDEGQYDDPRDIFWASGAALFLRMEVLNQVGLLDETFFMHFEEIDLCWRLQNAGYRIRVIPQSHVEHFVAASLPAESLRKMYWNHRNSLIMLIKNVPSRALWRTLIVRMLLDGVAILHAAARFKFTRLLAVFGAHAWIYGHIGLLRHKRRLNLPGTSDEPWHSMIYPGSIVVDYFLKKKRRFSMLNF